MRYTRIRRMRGLIGGVVCGGLLGLAPWGLAQQPPAPPDCQAQLGLAMQRAGTQQTLATQDREALILYFQAELRKIMQERDEARSKLENGAKPPEKEKP